MLNVFDIMQKQLSLQSLGKADKDFYLTKEEYEDFSKEVIFEQLKGKGIGEAFCEKFDQQNYVLMMLSDDSARLHIEKFYVRHEAKIY